MAGRVWRLFFAALLAFATGGSFVPGDGLPVVASRSAATGGTVWAWGSDRSGQLGDGTLEAPRYQPAPQAIAGLPEATAISAHPNGFYALALLADGTVRAWGDGASGQLGDGSSGSDHRRTTPQLVPGLVGVTAIAAGGLHGLALKADGTVWAWGSDYAGQLGDGTTGGPEIMPTPRQVPGLSGIVALAAGNTSSLARAADGRVWAWGQLGSAQNAPTPQPISGLTDVVGIAAGAQHALALRADGTVWAWGADTYGQLGDGTIGSPDVRTTPQQVPGLINVASVAAGARFSFAILRDGTVRAWGDDFSGQLGDGTVGSPSVQPVPQVVPGLSGVSAMSAGYSFTLAVRGDGSVWAWGDDIHGQLGDGTVGTPVTGPTPQPVSGLVGVLAIAGGVDFSLALVTTTSQPSPSASPSPSPTPNLAFSDVPAEYWAHDQIIAFAQRGITTGCDTDTRGNRYYCPERGVTRAEMAAFLTRALGQDQQAPPATATFADVPADYWAYGQIEAFLTLGITTGCGEDDQGRRLFCPERGVTRAEMAVFLVRAKGQVPLAPATSTFADVPADYWAYGFIERFLALGVTTGCGEDEQGRRVYCPDRGVTRAEMAVFIIRAYPAQYE